MMRSVKSAALLALLLLIAGIMSSCSSHETGLTDVNGPEQTVVVDVNGDESTGTQTGGQEGILLVNKWNLIPEDYAVDTRELPNQHRVAVDCYEPLLKMLDDCRLAGYEAEVISGFRTIIDQANLYENKVRRVMGEGYPRHEAEEIAAMEVALPGTSEHHTGLAVDIVDAGYGNLDETQAMQPTQQWLMEHCHEYGFILRYPPEKTRETGIIYEPWHYRYVGVELAKDIKDSGLCLEEYVDRQ